MSTIILEETNDGPKVSSRSLRSKNPATLTNCPNCVEIGSNDGQSSWCEAASHPSLIISLVAATFRRRCSTGTIRGKWISFYEFASWNFRAHCTRPMFSDDRSWITDNSWPFPPRRCVLFNPFRKCALQHGFINTYKSRFIREPIKVFKNLDEWYKINLTSTNITVINVTRYMSCIDVDSW